LITLSSLVAAVVAIFMAAALVPGVFVPAQDLALPQAPITPSPLALAALEQLLEP